ESPARLVFVNGVLRRDLSSAAEFPDEVVAIDLVTAANDSQFESVVRKLFERRSESAHGFVALNNSLFAGGLFLQLKRNAVVEAPIHLSFLTESGNGTTPAASPRVVVYAEPNSSATIIESYASAGAGAYLTNAVIDFAVE